MAACSRCGVAENGGPSLVGHVVRRRCCHLGMRRRACFVGRCVAIVRAASQAAVPGARAAPACRAPWWGRVPSRPLPLVDVAAQGALSVGSPWTETWPWPPRVHSVIRPHGSGALRPVRFGIYVAGLARAAVLRAGAGSCALPSAAAVAAARAWVHLLLCTAGLTGARRRVARRSIGVLCPARGVRRPVRMRIIWRV